MKSPRIFKVIIAALVLAQPLPVLATDAQFIAPADAPSEVMIAAPTEPGERFVVHGRVMDGAAPISGASVYVYHADAKGFYSADGKQDGRNHALVARLHGAIRTDAKGVFQYETVNPSGYGGAPAHVHYVVSAAGYKDFALELMFEGDPTIPPDLASRYKNPQYQLSIQPVVRDGNGIWRCTHDMALVRE